MTSLKKEKLGREVQNVKLVLEETSHKKRGRKPKGGKILSKAINDEEETTIMNNVILHLKCSSQDLLNHQNLLSYNPSVPPEIESYEKDNQNYMQYNIDTEKHETTNYAYENTSTNINYLCSTCNKTQENKQDIHSREIYNKLKSLKIKLYKNTLQDKKSACFWCTYEYDNPPCYIPMHKIEDEIFCYGSFCRPECAVSYLMKENIDDSSKFERYNLLNHIYGKIFNYKKSIKPAPDPYYTLDKFYGTLSIQEYRRFLNSEHLLTVIDKPMTRVLPELHEENDSFITKIYGIQHSDNETLSSNVYKVKRESEKKETVSKASIIKSTFNIG